MQEVIVDPMESLGAAMNAGANGGSAMQAAVLAAAPSQAAAAMTGDLDGSATPLIAEVAVVATPAQTSSSSNSSSLGGGTFQISRLEREYIWGPGDRFDDELLVQYDAERLPTWAIQDAGGDIVAICDTGLPGGLARVLGQWWYDAYGAARWAEHLGAFPVMRVGHKGLFFDRLDGGTLDAATWEEVPRLVPYAQTLYHARNRVYMPEHGRWLAALIEI